MAEIVEMNREKYISFKNLRCLNDTKSIMGHLTPIESGIDVPFEIKRIYYITNVPFGVERGYHAHKKLQQVLICLNGSVKILIDDSREREIVELSEPTKGLYIGPSVWRIMYDFSPGTVLLVLASEHYQEEDYIRDYETFQEWMKGGRTG